MVSKKDVTKKVAKKVVKEEVNPIWEAIKGRPIEMFALSNQKVEDHVIKLDVPVKNQLYLKLASSAVLPSLEAVCGEYSIEVTDKFVIIKSKAAEIVIN